jgi:hypothetical protein
MKEFQLSQDLLLSLLNPFAVYFLPDKERRQTFLKTLFIPNDGIYHATSVKRILEKRDFIRRNANISYFDRSYDGISLKEKTRVEYNWFVHTHPIAILSVLSDKSFRFMGMEDAEIFLFIYQCLEMEVFHNIYTQKLRLSLRKEM